MTTTTTTTDTDTDQLTEPIETSSAPEPTPPSEPIDTIPTRELREITSPSAPLSADALAAVLAQAPPIAGLLDSLACERLSPAGQLDAVVAWERLARHVHAGLMRA